jgi:isoquinoline 1-oxidoreductase subunit beta
LVDGRPQDTNHDTYTPLRMGDVPDVEVEFLPSTEMPVGLGEPATTVVGRSPTRSSWPVARACATLPIRPEAAQQALNPRA